MSKNPVNRRYTEGQLRYTERAIAALKNKYQDC